MTAGTSMGVAPERRGARLARAARSGGSGIGRTLAGVADRIGGGERALPYTILAIVGIALLGAIVVPLSIPEPLPEPPREEVLGERFLLTWSSPESPTAVAKLPAPAKDEVVKAYGTDGGVACTGSLAEAYDTLVTKRPGGGVAFDKAAFAQIRVAHTVYCPDRTPAFAQFVKRRAALNAQATRTAAT